MASNIPTPTSSPESSDSNEEQVPPCPPDCSCCGFDRPEMNSEPVMGSIKKLLGQAFVVYGKHNDWPSDATKTDTRIISIVSLLKKSLPKSYPVLVAEGISGEDRDGDVLFFPQGLRVRAGEDVRRVKCEVESDMAIVSHPRGTPVAHESRHIFVCAHGHRDRRCGRCGPELAECIEKLQDSRTHVRKCSHIGGHKFAGNLIVYDLKFSDSGDWYGYVTPSNLNKILKHSERKAFTSGIYQSHWRGRTGMSKDECINYASYQRQHHRINIAIGGVVLTATLAALAAFVFKSKQTKSTVQVT
ncbi:hypothetical protein FOL47_009101 [Perkinsus chesapeaki]|uniref:Altered inheritance of mitochondria protein 32 n=1 Tax=Perkinsus chesapeaki TaxID=330153 RepID=A0A7J6LAK6_PERCH|nr:hypothetical protein FOL47_009101 [Perkinsus chesapeaki]